MSIKVVDAVQEDLMAEVWDLYYTTFHELNAFAVQRHLMFRSEFDEVMLDTRVLKYLCLADDGSLCGLSTYTNMLDAMPLISPAYFERRWPELYAQNRIWYCGFVAVEKNGRAITAFSELVEAMYLTAAERHGIIGLDFCRFNDDQRHMARVIELKLRRLSGHVRAERMDEQAFWLYEFPAA
jgi:hypothetical protein